MLPLPFRFSIRRPSVDAMISCARPVGWPDACHDNPPRPGVERVRLPGENGLARKRAAIADGVQLFAGIIDSLRPPAERLGVAMPDEL
jgi:hypothetical protein